MEAVGVPAPRWRLTYSGKDISDALAPDAISISYTDFLEGQSDELEVSLQDRDGKWRAAWYPTKGDRLTLDIGYAHRPLMPCGTFEIDEVEQSGPPDVIRLRALAAGITGPLRTKNSRAFEGVGLREIAEKIAAEHGLAVVGQVGGPPFERVSQHDETDVAFLKRLASEHGHVFSVRGANLVFHELLDLRRAAPARTIGRGDMVRYRFANRTHKVYRACKAIYHDPATKEVIEHMVEDAAFPGGDVLKLTGRCETATQAETKARSALERANQGERKGSLVVPGEPSMVAGLVIAVAGLGVMDGRYLIETSRHAIDRRGGYTTELEVTRA